MFETRCPIRAGYVSCYRGDCAWWDKGQCAILSISRYCGDLVEAIEIVKGGVSDTDSEIKESKCETSKTETAKETPKAIYEGFSSHDCETWYKCPVCNKKFGSWSLPSGEKIANCPCCGAELQF